MTTTALSHDRAPDRAPEQRARRRSVPVWAALLATSLPMFMATLDNLVMTSALPVVRADLGASVDQLSWFLNAYSLAFASFMLPAATLGDRLGRRRMMLIGIAVFTLGSIGSALSTTSGALIAARAVQGLGAAAIMPLSLTLLAAAVPARLRPAAIGIWGGVSGLGVALGPVIGGAVVQGVSWQAIFWLNVPIAVVGVPFMLWAVSESRGSWQRMDLVGTAMLGGAVFLGVWGIVHGNTQPDGSGGWTSVGVLVPLVVGALLLPAYVLRARSIDHAVLPLRLFGSRSFSTANVIALFFTVGMFGTVFLLAQYLQVVQGYTPLEAGIRTLPWTAAPMVVAPIAGAIAPRVGLRPLLLIGLALQTASLVWLASLAEGHATYPHFVPALAMAGVGMGLTFAPMSTATLDGLPESDFAMASSANSTVREFGVALGIALLTAVFTGNGGQITPVGYDGAIGPAILTGAAAVAVAVLAACFVPRRRPHSEI
ncbi:DHA2 family efflux MFS transporter permease subunit [Nocardioides mangrovicus]|uniref:DHA2 family efflux MFS transporter permease subunit n=1 Tax=Nocardioides mangrovicus TaxID=2478913 RepID=A0A3L8NZ13_9ACTN|nr:MFS transporter [Nocardioides mangrovicus]RLV47892.1 DHA2 family efflux MFS transporter permease subunit [Nocardioides mangrovicus]